MNRKNNRIYKEILRRLNNEKEMEPLYPDYSNIKIDFGPKNVQKSLNEEMIYLLPHKKSSGKIICYVTMDKQELLENNVSEDYLSKLEYNYFLMRRNEEIKRKLHSKTKKLRVKFNFKSNIENKEYSDGVTIIEDLRKPKKVITMKNIMHYFITMKTNMSYSNEFFRNVYFDNNYIMKLRARVASGKKNTVYTPDQKSNIYCAKKYLTKKDLSKIKRIELCKYEKENK